MMGCAFLYVKEWEGKRRVSLPQSAMLTAPSSEGGKGMCDRRQSLPPSRASRSASLIRERQGEVRKNNTSIVVFSNPFSFSTMPKPSTAQPSPLKKELSDGSK